MSYGQPCRRMTAEPSAGPASTYPTFSNPASICFSGPNDCAFGLDCAFADPRATSSAAASVMLALRRKRRRESPKLSDSLFDFMSQSPLVRALVRKYRSPGLKLSLACIRRKMGKHLLRALIEVLDVLV